MWRGGKEKTYVRMHMLSRVANHCWKVSRQSSHRCCRRIDLTELDVFLLGHGNVIDLCLFDQGGAVYTVSGEDTVLGGITSFEGNTAVSEGAQGLRRPSGGVAEE